MSSGRLFQATGPATQNARLPSCSLVLGTTKSPRAAEWRAGRLGKVETRMESGHSPTTECKNPSHTKNWNLVYHAPATDLRGSCTGSNYNWLACGSLLACRRWALPLSPTGQHCQNGVVVLAISNLAIGFPLFLQL